MRILVNDYAGHPFELQLSRELASLGHTVLHTYFAAYQTPKGRTDNDGATDAHLTIRAIQLEGTFLQYSAWARRKADRAYGNALCREVETFRPDIVISANTPLDAQQLLLAATHKIGARFVFWLQDLLSAAVAFVLRKKGVPLAGLAGKLYARMERRLLQKSDAVICIAPEFRQVLRTWGIASEKTFVIENWAPLDEIEQLPTQTAFRLEQELADKFCFMYSGTLGMKHKPELLLALAQHFAGRDDISILVVAQGAGADWLKAQAASREELPLAILPFQPYERHAEILASSDTLITLLDDDCGAFAVPSKLLAYMCAGRSLLVAAPSDNLASRIVTRAEAGIAVPASPSAFIQAANTLVEQANQRAAFAANARTYAEQTFQIDQICDQFVQIFTYALGSIGDPLSVKSVASLRAAAPPS